MKRYIRGFDGLRTVGVLGVIVYHLFPTALKGGFLGVVLFFVLSGYLVTDLLLQELESRGKVAIKSFYIRRFRRLYPSLLVVFAGTAIYSALFQREFLNQLRMTVISGLFSFNNWWQIAKGASYFANLTQSAPFSHLYSLAIEAQFYLFWPIIVALVYHLVANRERSFYGIMGTALFSALLMALLYRGDADPTRVYYGTDTRLYSVLIGAALAFIWPSHLLYRIPIKEAVKSKIYLGTAGLLAFISLFYFFLPDQHWFTYRGGMLFFSFLSALLVGLVAMPQLAIDKWFSNPIFDYIGKRSYEIYLWQTPVFALVEARFPKLNSNFWGVAFEILLILLLSEGTYQLVRRGKVYFTWSGFKAAVSELLAKGRFSPQKLRPLAYLSLCLLTFGIVAFSPDTSKAEQALVNEIQANQKALEEAKANQELNLKSDNSIDDDLVSRLSQTYQLDEETVKLASKTPILMIGDSLVTKTYFQFSDLFPMMVIDAEWGRLPENSFEIVRQNLETYPSIDTIFMVLGTNENEFDQTISLEHMAEFMTILEEKEVYWANVHLEYSQFPFTEQINEVIEQTAVESEKLHLVNWYQAASGHPDWFDVDGFHPNEEGSVQFVRLFAQALADQLAKQSE